MDCDIEGAAAADKAALQPRGVLLCMEKATAEQGDEVQQREGGVVLEVAEAAANLRCELSALICGVHVVKSKAACCRREHGQKGCKIMEIDRAKRYLLFIDR